MKKIKWKKLIYFFNFVNKNKKKKKLKNIKMNFFDFGY